VSILNATVKKIAKKINEVRQLRRHRRRYMTAGTWCCYLANSIKHNMHFAHQRSFLQAELIL